MNKNNCILRRLTVGVASIAGLLFISAYEFDPSQERIKNDPHTYQREWEIKRFQELQELLKQSPDDPNVHKDFGDFYRFLLRAEPKKALDHYLKAEQLAPGDIGLLRDIMRVHQSLRNYPEVINYAQRILLEAPALSDESYLAMAESYYELEEYENAVKNYEKIFHSDKKWLLRNYYQRFGRAYYNLGRYQEAIQIFQNVPGLKQIPDSKGFAAVTGNNGVAYYYLGFSYLKINQKTKAKAAFHEALGLFRASKNDKYKNEIEEIERQLQEMRRWEVFDSRIFRIL